MDQKFLLSQQHIQDLIYTVRGRQVMLDSDLARIYDVETKVFNQAVKRNEERFPESFRFRLTEMEYAMVLEQHNSLRSQTVTSTSHGGRRYLPYVFSEPGIAMLSAVLRSMVAVKVSIAIMEAFVEMRAAIQANASLFYRVGTLEAKQLETAHKFDEIFKALESGKLHSDKGIFYDGQVFDAHTFISGIIRSATKSIILVDNYVDDTVLTLLGKRSATVSATIYTKDISTQLKLDLQKYNSQYPVVTVKTLTGAHDRFLLIDGTALYHIGASIKDLGKKWFAFSRLDIEAGKMLQLLNAI